MIDNLNSHEFHHSIASKFGESQNMIDVFLVICINLKLFIWKLDFSMVRVNYSRITREFDLYNFHITEIIKQLEKCFFLLNGRWKVHWMVKKGVSILKTPRFR